MRACERVLKKINQVVSGASGTAMIRERVNNECPNRVCEGEEEEKEISSRT